MIEIEVIGLMNSWVAFVIDTDWDTVLAKGLIMEDWMVVRNTGIGLDSIIAMTEV